MSKFVQLTHVPPFCIYLLPPLPLKDKLFGPVIIAIAIIVNANTHSTYIRHCFNGAGWHTAKYSLDTKVAVLTFSNIKVVKFF